MQNHNHNLLSKSLSELRKKSKLTQKAIADAMGVSVAMYSKIELGERTVQIKQIPLLAQCLDIKESEIQILCLVDKLKSEADNYPRDVVGKALDIVYNQYKIQ